MIRVLRVCASPIWEEPDGSRRAPERGEVRSDLPVVGWCNVLEVDWRGQLRRFLVARQVSV